MKMIFSDLIPQQTKNTSNMICLNELENGLRYKAFDKNESTMYSCGVSNNNEYIGYIFDRSVFIGKIIALMAHPHGTNNGKKYAGEIQITTDGINWNKISDFDTGTILQGKYYTLSSIIGKVCKGIRVIRTSYYDYDSNSSTTGLGIACFEFYVYGK